MTPETTAPPALQFDDIQGDILRAYGNRYTHTIYLFAGLASPAKGRAWLGELAPQVTPATEWAEGRPGHHVNVARTYAGLVALGLPEHVTDSFSAEFRAGMAARAARLGDTGASAPSRWSPGLGTGEAHVLVTVNALDEDRCRQAVAGIEDAVARHGHRIVARQDANLLGGAREHFGFADGFSQPAIAGVRGSHRPGGGVPTRDAKTGEPGWRPLQPGEFVLGYPDEDTVLDERRRLPRAPAGPLGRNGTYMVWRRLHQDVALFRRTVRAAAEHWEDGDEARLRAKLVGRWDNGAPLVLYPDGPPADYDGHAHGANDFRYLPDDASGGRCPIGAHARRSNPRDALGWDGHLSFRHRMIRRGMPYGDPLPPGQLRDDRGRRGLVFVSFGASISRGFEAVQVQWLNDGNVFGLGHDSDFIMGRAGRGGSMVVQGECPFYVSPQARFTTVRGGEYLYVPGIDALHQLADDTIR